MAPKIHVERTRKLYGRSNETMLSLFCFTQGMDQVKNEY